MREVAEGPYKNYLRMRKIHQSDGMKLGGNRLGAVFLLIRAMLWLLGVKRDFVGVTLYMETVGSIHAAPGGTPDDLGNNQFALKLWFRDWP